MFRFLKKKVDEAKEKAVSEMSEEDVFADGKGYRIKPGKLEDLMWDIEMGLLESDVAAPVAAEIITNVKEELLEKRVKRGVELGDAVEAAIRHSVVKVLNTASPVNFDEVLNGPKPVVIMFVGVNGTGKTTAIARIAYRLVKMKRSCVLAAGDTFRAGAVEQLQRHADRLGLRLIKHRPGSDPAAVAYDAIEHARARGRDIVLVDTAGRMQTNANLMDEMKKIKRVAQPKMIIFVGDALAGNDAVEQATKFNEAVGIDAAILTKIDADAKGGAALSIAYAVGKPVLFVGTGQDYKDLMPFDAKWMVDRLFEDSD